MVGIQLIAIAVGLAAVHLTHLYYKRSHFSKKELLFWGFLWCAFIGLAIFPRSISPLAGYLGLARPMDLIMIAAFIALFFLAFHNYVLGRKHGRDLERLVREVALMDLEK